MDIMARAVRKCDVCKRLYPVEKRRKTCSPECHSKLARTIATEAIAKQNAEPKAEFKAKKTVKPQSDPLWLPSPEYIKEQCRLIREAKGETW